MVLLELSVDEHERLGLDLLFDGVGDAVVVCLTPGVTVLVILHLSLVLPDNFRRAAVCLRLDLFLGCVCGVRGEGG